jgi:hypothetical protein
VPEIPDYPRSCLQISTQSDENWPFFGSACESPWQWIVAAKRRRFTKFRKSVFVKLSEKYAVVGVLKWKKEQIML